MSLPSTFCWRSQRSPLLDQAALDAGLRRLDAEALRVVGIDPELANLDPMGGTARKKKHRPFTSEAKKVLSNSLREALDMGDRHIDVTHSPRNDPSRAG